MTKKTNQSDKLRGTEISRRDLLKLSASAIMGSERGGWKLRPMREGFVYTAAIVTSFTVAHSVTLIAAALGWIDLPGLRRHGSPASQLPVWSPAGPV